MKNLYYFTVMGRFLNELYGLWFFKNNFKKNENDVFYQE